MRERKDDWKNTEQTVAGTQVSFVYVLVINFECTIVVLAERQNGKGIKR